MRKLITLAAFVSGFMANAQFELTNNFSNWDNGVVVGWNGSTTHNSSLTITEITDGAVFGNSAVQLATEGTTHRRFSSNPVPVEEGVEYRFKYFARGKGDIRVGLFDNDLGNDDFGYKYSAYFVLDSEEWIEINQAVIADTTYEIAQFIFSVRNSVAANGHIQIDSVSITTGVIEQVSIYEIQFTTIAGGASEFEGQTLATGGIITGVRPNPNGGYFVQSGTGLWSGIYVFDPSNVEQVAIGDSIVLVGTVEERFGNTQIAAVSSFGIVSNGNTLPEALTVPTGTLSTEPYEGVLVRAFEATCTAAPNAQNVWTLNDGSGNVFVDDDIYSHSPVVLNNKYNVTGPLFFTFSQFRILPRFPQDVELVQSVSIASVDNNEISVFPNPASDFVSIRNTASADAIIELMDMNGRIVVKKHMSNTPLLQIAISELNAGIYNLRIVSSASISNHKLIIQ